MEGGVGGWGGGGGEVYQTQKRTESNDSPEIQDGRG